MHIFSFPITSRLIASRTAQATIAMVKRRIVLRFDPLLRAQQATLKRSIANFAAHLDNIEARDGTRKRQRKASARAKLGLAVEALLANLIVAYGKSPKALLNIPLSNTVLKGNPRYRPEIYGQHFRDLIALLIKTRLITMVTKGHNVREWRRKEITTICVTRKLLKVFPALVTFAGAEFSRVGPPETVILKDEASKLLDYIDDADTRRWRGEMERINLGLRGADVCVISSRPLIDASGFTIQPEARSLRRIFNNGDWTQGGRLYDGFWQTFEREHRLKMIRIDGEPIANVDFGQFNLRLAYALAGIDPPPGDLYDVTGYDHVGHNWQHLREGRKKLASAAFNRTAPLTRWPGQTAEERKALADCFPPGTTARTATNDIRTKHFAIAGYFEAGRGLGFMRVESDILIAALLSLMRNGITALPIHDAVLVAERHAETAKAVMEIESKRRIGTAIPADIKMASEEKARPESLPVL